MGELSAVATYEGWARCQGVLVDRLTRLGPAQVRLRASADGWPIWAIVGHIAVVRVYWLCGVCQEAGAELTAFPDPLGDGWEDNLDLERSPEELLFAVQSSWRIVESCLERWTPEMLAKSFTRERAGELQVHSRASVLTRLVMHDAFHCGEASIILGMHGLRSTDPRDPAV